MVHAATRPRTRSVAADEAAPEARTRILDAAELVFSEAGYGAASMKAIASQAGVAQGLLHYHFDGKDGLYNAVIARRAGAINTARRAALEAVDLDAANALAAIFDALLRPPLSDAGGGTPYARIFASLAVGTQRDQDLVAAHYDETARLFIDAIERAAPGVDRAAAVWSYSLAIGALVMVVGRNGRIERLADRADAPFDIEETIDLLVAHAVAGLRGLIAVRG